MSRRKFIFVVMIGIAFVAVPFVFRAIDRNNSDKHIREFEVNDDETDEGEKNQGKASGGKKNLPRRYQTVPSALLRSKVSISAIPFLRERTVHS